MVRVITDYLDRTASRLGDKTAYTDDRRSVTWKEIREESRRVGQALVNAGLFKKPVAIFIGKKIECIAAVFGVAYSGNFYTVIDTDMPEERIRKIISTLQPAAVIAEEGMHVPDGICGADAEIFYYADMQRVKPDDSVLFRTGKKIFRIVRCLRPCLRDFLLPWPLWTACQCCFSASAQLSWQCVLTAYFSVLESPL